MPYTRKVNSLQKNWHLAAVFFAFSGRFLSPLKAAVFKIAAKSAVAEHLAAVFSNRWNNRRKSHFFAAVFKLPQN